MIELLALRAADGRQAMLWAGQRAGRWIYRCQHQGHYLLEIDGTLAALTPAEVDQLPLEIMLAPHVTIVDGSLPTT